MSESLEAALEQLQSARRRGVSMAVDPMRQSDILQFWAENPDATEEDVRAFTGRIMEHPCPGCGGPLQLCDIWSAGKKCWKCRSLDHAPVRECGCALEKWERKAKGWHLRDYGPGDHVPEAYYGLPVAHERCRPYHDAVLRWRKMDREAKGMSDPGASSRPHRQPGED